MRERHTNSSRYSSLIASEVQSVGSCPAIGYEEGYLSLMRPVRIDMYINGAQHAPCCSKPNGLLSGWTRIP